MKHGILIDKINVENWYAQIQKGLKGCNYDTGINVLLNYLLQEIETAIANAPAAAIPLNTDERILSEIAQEVGGAQEAGKIPVILKISPGTAATVMMLYGLPMTNGSYLLGLKVQIDPSIEGFEIL